MTTTYTAQQATSIQTAVKFLQSGFGTMRQVTEALATALNASIDEAHEVIRTEISK